MYALAATNHMLTSPLNALLFSEGKLKYSLAKPKVG